MKEVLKTLTIKVFHVDEVSFGDKITLDDSKLAIDDQLDVSNFPDIREAKVSLLKPNERDVTINTILDFIPISTKIYGELGEGITHTMTGVYVMLTAREHTAQKYFNFSDHTNLKDSAIPNIIGTYSDADYLIHIDIITEDDTVDPRQMVYHVHQAADNYIQKIRNVLKQVNGLDCTEEHIYHEQYNKAGRRVVMIQQLGGQGVMHENLVLPFEPSGVEGAYSIIDLKNMPVVLSPNEYRDGAIRAMT